MDRESVFSTGTVVTLGPTDDEPIIPFNPSYINTISSFWKLTELLMFVICLTSFIFLQSFYMESDAGKWLYHVSKHLIWIYLIIYLITLVADRYQWHNFLVEVIYLALWILFIYLSTYVYLRQEKEDGAWFLTIILGFTAISMYEILALIKYFVQTT